MAKDYIGNQEMNPLELVNLMPLMERTEGRLETIIGLIDGPVLTNCPDLVGEHIHAIPGSEKSECNQANSIACQHGTFAAGILCAHRHSIAPAICPGCTLLVRPIFTEASSANGQIPSARPEELATAILECIEAGACILNLSLALVYPSGVGESVLKEVLDYAARHNVLVVAAAGNQGMFGSSVITRHSWIIPVVACDMAGHPLTQSNLGCSIGRHGLSAPGDAITSLGADGKPVTLGGTSAAAPFVTGAIALLWSEFPSATAATVHFAITHSSGTRRTTIVPPFLDAWGAYQIMNSHLQR